MECRVTVNSYRVSLGGDSNVLDLGSGNSSTTL